jgi:hypothetical protein
MRASANTAGADRGAHAALGDVQAPGATFIDFLIRNPPIVA